MSLVETIKSLFTPLPDRYSLSVKAAPLSTEYFGPLAQRNADWSMIRDGEKVRDVWAKCATAYACITLIADAVAESPLRVYQTVDGELEERPDHRVRTLIANPNPIMSEAEFMVLTVMTMGLYGYAVTEKVRSAGNVPVELWPLRPDWLRHERTNDGSGRWIYRRPQTDPREIAADDLIFIPYRNDPSQVHIGLSPLHIVAREIGIDVALTDLLKVFIDAGGIPPWAIEIPESVNDNDPALQARIDAFREKWMQKYGGANAYRNIGILYGGMKMHQIGSSIGDMAWPDLRGLTELKIAQAFRVPADLIQARDTLGGNPLAVTQIEGAMAVLQNHGAQPLRMRIDGAFSRGLLTDFTGGDSRFSLEFDTSAILSLQEDEDAKHARWRANYSEGLAMLDEARQGIGLPPLPNDQGQVFKQAFTTMLIPANALTGGTDTERASQGATIRSAPMPALAEGKAERVYRDLKALSPAELETRASILTNIQRDKQKLTEIGTRKLRTFFREQGKRIVGSLPAQRSFDIPRSRMSGKEIKADVIDWDEEERLLRDILERFYAEAGDRAFGHVSATTGVTIAWDLSSPFIAQIMNELGERIVGISETTRQETIQIITQAQAEGANLQTIADRLTDLYDGYSKNRAMVVARTETMASYGKASIAGWQESGVVDQVEIVDNPDHTEPYEGAADGLTCAERHGLQVPLDKAEFHLMSDHPNGSCTLIGILAKPLGEV